MKKGKIFVIEGTDCSGKEMQSNMLVERLNDDGIETVKFGFPKYDSPTGKIIGGPYLGKEKIGQGWFPEGAPNVPSKVASLYYAADRLYNIGEINDAVRSGKIVVLDRYVESNMAFQAGKIDSKHEREEMFRWLERLEYDFLELPRADKTILLYLPYEYACILKKQRAEAPDQIEMDENLLRQAEAAYLELAGIYGFERVDCAKDNVVRSPRDIHEEVYAKIKKLI